MTLKIGGKCKGGFTCCTFIFTCFTLDNLVFGAGRLHLFTCQVV